MKPSKKTGQHSGVSNFKKTQRQAESRERQAQRFAHHHQRTALTLPIQTKLSVLLSRQDIPVAVKNKIQFQIAPKAQAILDLKNPHERRQRFLVINPENRKWVLELLPEEIALEFLK